MGERNGHGLPLAWRHLRELVELEVAGEAGVK
jgi:hypothetical protein